MSKHLSRPVVISTECTWTAGDLYLPAGIPTPIPQDSLEVALSLSGVVLVTPPAPILVPSQE